MKSKPIKNAFVLYIPADYFAPHVCGTVYCECYDTHCDVHDKERAVNNYFETLSLEQAENLGWHLLEWKSNIHSDNFKVKMLCPDCAKKLK